MTQAERIAAARAWHERHVAERQELVSLRERLERLGGIELAESLAAWKNEVLEKIETLPTVTKTTVKRLLGLI